MFQILIIDPIEPDRGFMNLVSRCLGALQMYRASTLTEARMILRQNKIDFILMELNFPDGTCLSFLEENRGYLEDSATSVIIVTSSAFLQANISVFEAGLVDEVILKPIIPKEM